MKKTITILMICIILMIPFVGCTNKEAKALTDEGITLIKEHNYEGSIKKFDEAIAINKRNKVANLLRDTTTKYLEASKLYKEEEFIAANNLLKEIDDNFNEYVSFIDIQLLYSKTSSVVDSFNKFNQTYDEFKEMPFNISLENNEGTLIWKDPNSDDKMFGGVVLTLGKESRPQLIIGFNDCDTDVTNNILREISKKLNLIDDENYVYDIVIEYRNDKESYYIGEKIADGIYIKLERAQSGVVLTMTAYGDNDEVTEYIKASREAKEKERLEAEQKRLEEEKAREEERQRQEEIRQAEEKKNQEEQLNNQQSNKQFTTADALKFVYAQNPWVVPGETDCYLFTNLKYKDGKKYYEGKLEKTYIEVYEDGTILTPF